MNLNCKIDLNKGFESKDIESKGIERKVEVLFAVLDKHILAWLN